MSGRVEDARPLDGRMAATLAVADALAGRQFVSEGLRTLRAGGQLDGREAALATEAALGAVRHLLTIEHVLAAVARFDRRRTSAALRAVLATAAYQIIWMDRIPPFAAVDEAVSTARRLVQARASGMVNAVLRRLADAISVRRVPWVRLDAAQVRVSWDQACAFDRAVLPPADADSDITAHLAAATGERPQRFHKQVARHGLEAAEAIAWASQAVPATVLQRQALRATPEEFRRELRAAYGDDVQVTDDAAFLPAAVNVVDALPFQRGLVYVQDQTAHDAALALRAQPGERILDLCAAPGGKSAALAVELRDQGEIVACDTVPERLLRVRENATRLGLACIRTRLLAAERPELPDDAPPFDAALVDVPCSNTGVIARRPEARLGLTMRKLGSLVAAQAELLRRAASRVRPGGRLVYSTCSLEPEENEQIVAAFLGEDRAWRLDAEKMTLPAWGPHVSAWRDGGHWARLVSMTG